MSRLNTWTTSTVLALLVMSCGGGPSTTLTPAEEKALNRKISAEAYLFDAKVYRDKKPTSVRLEIFHTDSVIGLAGRGYLGKGALKGRLTADSIEVYFPSTNEYLYEAVPDLMNSFDCVGDLPQISLFALLGDLPDEVLAGQPAITVSVEKSHHRNPEYLITADGCPWQIEVTYARQKNGWRVKEFVFSEDGQTVLKGKRRNYKQDASVKLKRFVSPARIGAVRISP